MKNTRPDIGDFVVIGANITVLIGTLVSLFLINLVRLHCS